jgi:hypothetical protein
MSNLRAALVTALNKMEMDKQMQNNELKATINEWANDDKQEPDVKSYGFKPTNNVSRETFNAVRDNPNKTNGELVKILQGKGFNPSSVGSLLAQMARQNIVQRSEDGTFSTKLTEYTPIKGVPTKQKKKHVEIIKRPYVKSGKYATKSGIAALGQHTAYAEPAPAQAPLPMAPPRIPPKPPAPIAPPAFDPEALLSTLSFPQVLVLYKKIEDMLTNAGL